MARGLWRSGGRLRVGVGLRVLVVGVIGALVLALGVRVDALRYTAVPARSVPLPSADLSPAEALDYLAGMTAEQARALYGDPGWDRASLRTLAVLASSALRAPGGPVASDCADVGACRQVAWVVGMVIDGLGSNPAFISRKLADDAAVRFAQLVGPYVLVLARVIGLSWEHYDHPDDPSLLGGSFGARYAPGVPPRQMFRFLRVVADNVAGAGMLWLEVAVRCAALADVSAPDAVGRAIDDSSSLRGQLAGLMPRSQFDPERLDPAARAVLADSAPVLAVAFGPGDPTRAAVGPHRVDELIAGNGIVTAAQYASQKANAESDKSFASKDAFRSMVRILAVYSAHTDAGSVRVPAPPPDPDTLPAGLSHQQIGEAWDACMRWSSENKGELYGVALTFGIYPDDLYSWSTAYLRARDYAP